MKSEKFKTVLSQILEPFALGLLALLFIIPGITVMNLAPITKQLQKLNVLGVATEEGISITLVEGKHEIFVSENLVKLDKKYEYSTTLARRNADSYSKPILEIENRSAEEKTLIFYGYTGSNTHSNIFLRTNTDSYKLQDDKGFTYTEEIVLAPQQKTVFFLAIENFSGVQFSETFGMDISVKEVL